ncbi:unnamed protein product [Peniophora sp. CBMAI 1063]|nr:unnamed protein product [Peniophora sp. CBMAI 1063]
MANASGAAINGLNLAGGAAPAGGQPGPQGQAGTQQQQQPGPQQQQPGNQPGGQQAQQQQQQPGDQQAQQQQAQQQQAQQQQAQQQPDVGDIARAAELERELREINARLLASAASQPPTGFGPMFLSKDAAAAGREQIAAKAGIAPAVIQPGFMANPQATAIGETARKTIRRLGYCPLTSLDSEARARTNQGEPEMVIQPNGTLKERDLERGPERYISERRWHSAKKVYVRVLREEAASTGEGTADAFEKHFEICEGFIESHGFSVALAYDMKQRELHAAEKRHDLSLFNTEVLTLVATAKRTADAAFPAQVPVPAARRNPRSSPPTTGGSSRPAPARGTVKCFRCIELGHMPITCPAGPGATTPAGKPVCKLAKVTPLDADAIEALLVKLHLFDDWKHVVDSLRSGFDAGVDTSLKSTYSPDNHNSVNLDPSFIDSYIAGELAANRYAGPFDPPVLEDVIGPFRTNPLGLVPKPGTDKHRMVNDLSHPRKGKPIEAVNVAIDRDRFLTEWGDFKAMSDTVLAAPAGSMAATFDISAAYRITPIRPDQQHVLCILWRGKVYVDRAACFGMASSSGIFGAIADMLVAIYKASGFRIVLKWVDDFVVFRMPGDDFDEHDFTHLTEVLGVPWAVAKTRSFAYRQKYIGFIWDLVRKTVSMPEDKLQALRDLLSSWLVPGARFDAREADSLHGKVVHAATIFPLVRPFLPSISAFPRKFTNGLVKRHPSGPVLKDIEWILDILSSTPNEISLSYDTPLDIGWWGDASSSWGIGVVVGSFWAAWQWAGGVTVGPKADRDIGWAEAVAVELGLRMAIHHDLLKARPVHRSRILVRSDNMGVVAVVNKGRSRSASTNDVLKSIFRLLTAEGVLLSTEYVASRDNITDALSRGDIPSFLAGFPGVPTVMKTSAIRLIPAECAGDTATIVNLKALPLRPSPLRPDVPANERIYKWRGVNTPPSSVLPIAIIEYLYMRARNESLAPKTSSGYGSGLRKFHVFCDIHSIPERARLPASVAVLNSFALWSAADPDPADPAFAQGEYYEPVSIPTVKSYLSSVCAWHIIQGWPDPLSEQNHKDIDFCLRGLRKMQLVKRSHPPRPPVTLPMLSALRSSLDISKPYDACLWAIATCAFWGMMRFGEATVDSRKDYSPETKLARKHVFFGRDLDGKPYARLDLPTAKTAKNGEIQKIFLTEQGDYCPIAALQNLARVVPAEADDPLFSWVDRAGEIRPMTRSAALASLNAITERHGWGTAFGHSFRIGGASFYLAQGVSPEVVRLAGRWKSLAYEAYIRAFELVASRHMAGLGAGRQPVVRPASALVG